MSAQEDSLSSTPSQPGGDVRAPKRRSPFERVVVWGAIAIGVFLIATEGLPRLRYWSDFRALDDAVMNLDETSNRGVVESQAKELVTRFTTHTVREKLPSNELAAPRVDTYTYKGLISERVFYVYYGHTLKDEEPEVLAVRTEPVEFVYATVPGDDLQPKSLDTGPVESETAQEGTAAAEAN